MKKYTAAVFSFLSKSPLSLAIILLVLTILRIPNFFEPYWYGDEGIYLTIGLALQRGAKLYAEIVDHKTPLIYFLAISGSQLAFRILLYFWMVVTTTAFFFIAKKLFKRASAVITATAVFMLITTLPWFEGNIPNGELFVMGFVIVGLWVLTKTRYFSLAMELTGKEKSTSSTQEMSLLFISGALASLGILTKVPALFDAAALFTIGYFGVVGTALESSFSKKAVVAAFRSVLKSWFFLGLGVVVPLVLSVLYFVLRGTGNDYLQFGLLYNFKYAGSWDLGITNPLLAFFFTLPGKVVFLMIWFIALTLLSKIISRKYLFCFGWFALALVASLLSNRPYPHYFLQVVPPLALCVAVTIESLANLKKKHPAKALINTSLAIGSVGFLTYLLLTMNVGLYQTGSYYRNFFQFMTGQLNTEQYFQTFNYLMKENYQLAARIKLDNPDKIFIWGTNPSLYALSETRPVGKFTVSFHIEDLGVQPETMVALSEEKPRYIIIMKNQTAPLPGLDSLLASSYMRVDTTENMIVWKKIGS